MWPTSVPPVRGVEHKSESKKDRLQPSFLAFRRLLFSVQQAHIICSSMCSFI